MLMVIRLCDKGPLCLWLALWSFCCLRPKVYNFLTPLSLQKSEISIHQFIYFLLIVPHFRGIQLVVTVLSHCCNSRRARAMRPPKYDPTPLLLDTMLLNPEASHTKVKHRTTGIHVSVPAHSPP